MSFTSSKAMLQDTRFRIQEADYESTIVLKIVADLFQALNNTDIRYCHWKSNLRLERGLYGQTDMDLLVDPQHRQIFKQLLEKYRIKPILAPPGKRYPSIEDYLGFDPLTGRLFHLHVHYQLVLGEQFVKNYHLPLENEFLDSVQIHSGVKIPSPELELIVLSIRALLKYRDRDVIKDIFSIRSSGMPSHILEEFNWLLGQTSIEKVSDVLTNISNVIPPDLILNLLTTILVSPRAGYKLFHLRKQARRVVRRYQRHERLQATITYFVEAWRRRKSFLRFKPERKMTLPTGGVTLALVGADGAGKTTLSRELVKWLSWKLDVHPYYLGSKQPSWMSKFSYLLFRIARRGQRTLSRIVGENAFITRFIEALRQILLYSHYLFIGHDRYGRYLAGRRNASEGSIVIFDRYPLEAPLDGPQIHAFREDSTDLIVRTFSKLERNLYSKVQMPDLFCVLEVSPEISIRRKPDHQWMAIETKNLLLRKLTDSMKANDKEVRIAHINAGLPLEQVLLQIKRAIWGAL